MGAGKAERERRARLFENGIKVCCTCKRELPLDAFNKDTGCSDGLCRMCRECSKASGRNHYKNHSDNLKKRAQIWRTNNQKKVLEYRKNNAEYYFEYNAKYREEHKEYFKQYHKDHDKEYLQTERGRLVHKSIQHRRRARKKSAEGDYTSDDLMCMLDFFDYRCAYTGEPLELHYHLDHIVPLSKNGTNYIWNIVPSNKSPNCSKGQSELEQWYMRQAYFSEERLQKIYEWINLQKSIKENKQNESRNIEEIAV